MRRCGRHWLWLALVGCSSASDAAPPPVTHDVIEVSVTPPPPNDASVAPREQASAPPASALVSAFGPSSAAPLEGVPMSAGLGGVPSSAVGGVAGPSRMGSAVVTLLSTTGGKIDNAGAVVAGMAAGFRRCYRRGLGDAPSSAGRVQIVAKIAPNGEVTSASPKAIGSLSGPVLSCLAARVASAQFAPPSKSPASLTISVALSPN